MKWGRKKPSSSASSSSFTRPSLISNVLPASWLTKFKRMSTNSSGQDNVSEPKLNGKSNVVYTGPSWCANGGGREGGAGEEGVNGGDDDDDDDDAFWRLSFREEAVGGSNGNGSVLRSVWYHNHCEHQDQLNLHRPSPSCRRFSDAREEEEVVPKFCDMVSQLRETRGLPRRFEVSTTAEKGVGEKVVEIRTPRLRVENVKKLRRRNQRGNSGDQKLLENVSRDKPGKEVTGDGKVKREDYNLVRSDARTSMDGCLWDEGEEGEVIRRRKDEEPCGGETNPEWKKMKEMKIEEIKQRKTLYISREVVEKQRPKHKAIKVKSYSPRLAAKAETCRIRALEEMKRARLKSMKRREKRNEGSTLGLDSFAVVKTSLDPQKDFRDSMMEMIKEQGISRPEELEDLLACYLTLNYDEYHELIIKVFRQVWFDMNQTCKFSELENEKVLL